MTNAQRIRRIAVGTAFFLSAVMGMNADAKDAALATLLAEHFRDTATVKEDPGAGTATVSTEPGFVERTGLLRMVWSDEFLKGVIDRKTGEKSFEVIVLVVYSGDFRGYDSAEFSTAAGKRTVKATLLQKQVDNCAVSECTYSERVAFEVDDESLRQLASESIAGKPSLWRYKLVARKGSAFNGNLSTAEIAGFLAKVDQVGDAAPVNRAPAASMPQPLPPVKTVLADLGVEGISVAASAELPNRAGVLITGVRSGSVSQKTGIIVGDIVYDFDGRPTATPQQLQAAAAAVTPGSRHALQLYRGLATMTLNPQF